MTFIEAQKSMYLNFAKIFDGKAGRREFWFSTLFLMLGVISFFILITLLVGTYASVSGADIYMIAFLVDLFSSFFTPFLIFFIVVPVVAVQVRRFHDINKSGRTYFIYAVLLVICHGFFWVYGNDYIIYRSLGGVVIAYTLYYAGTIGGLIIFGLMTYFLGFKDHSKTQVLSNELQTEPNVEASKLSFIQIVKNMYANFSKIFEGRASRREFWFNCLFSFLVVCVLNLLAYVLLMNSGAYKIFNNKALYPLLMFLVFTPIVAVQVRRCHDVNKSAKFFFTIFCLECILAFICICTGVVLISSNVDISTAVFAEHSNSLKVIFGLSLGLSGVISLYMFYLLGFKPSNSGVNNYGEQPE